MANHVDPNSRWLIGLRSAKTLMIQQAREFLGYDASLEVVASWLGLRRSTLYYELRNSGHLDAFYTSQRAAKARLEAEHKQESLDEDTTSE